MEASNSISETGAVKPTADQAQDAERIRAGLQALYDFDSSTSAIIKDIAGVGEPVDLRIANPKSVRQVQGAIEVHGKTLIQSEGPASRITEAVRQSGEITIEAWIQPANTTQNGPARIISLSANPNVRNFTLGQDGDRFDVRLRSTSTNANGIPSLSSPSKSADSKLTHIVYTRQRGGRARMYINGKRCAESQVAGDLSNWDGSFRLVLANELTKDRPWQGTFYLAAIYNRALSTKEVQQNFRAGHQATSQAVELAKKKQAQSAELFDKQVANIFSRHCLECHGLKMKKGRLDLTQKASALAGGISGKAIVAGQPSKSLLWEYVSSGEMPPKDRPHLTDQEKRYLQQWIETGAIWTREKIARPAFADERIEPHREFEWTGNQRDPGPFLVRRLTVPEYIETVRSAIGVDIEAEARKLLPPDLQADGFNNTAYNLNVDLSHIEAFAVLAQIIVDRLNVRQFAAQFTKRQGLRDESLRQLVADMGKWILRGPLEDREIAAYLKVARAVAKEGGNFEEAVRYVIEAMLQSPRFIYRMENNQGDGSPQRVQGYELASRLSYILWGGPPDAELFRAAEAGELSQREQVLQQVQRMLKDPRAIRKSVEFISQWLQLDRLDHLSSNHERFPQWNKQLAEDMRAETIAYFKYVAWEQNRPLSDLLNAQVTFATPLLAKYYGLDPKYIAAGPDGRKPTSTRGRVTKGLGMLYTFHEGTGTIIHDVSGRSPRVDLHITNPAATAWSKDGLTIKAPALIMNERQPTEFVEAVKQSSAFTLEAWVTPGDLQQKGPARLVSLSNSVTARNFTLGQEQDKYEIRFRTTATDANGLPGLQSSPNAVATKPTHILYTRNPDGKTKLYLNGQEKSAGTSNGDLSNWEDSFRLLLANELSQDRPWRGTFHLVAIYSRALSPDEVRQNYAAGPRHLQGLSRYDLKHVPSRGGLLTQASVLTVGGDEASMVARGLFILNDLLCSAVGDPPPCVDTTPVPTKPGLSQRAVSMTRLANASCVGCHAKFEPLAFGLEKFDGRGAFREKDEHGNILRDDGEILFPGKDKAVAYQSSRELMNLLANSERVRQAFTLKVTQFALGRPLLKTDAPFLKEIHETAQKNGGTYASLMMAIVMSDLVQMKRTERPMANSASAPPAAKQSAK